MEGRYVPSWVFPAFYVQDIKMRWKRKVEVHSGVIKVTYDPWILLKSRKLRIRVTGKRIPVTFFPGGFVEHPSGQATLDGIYADLTVGRNGLEKIHALHGGSREVEFHIGPKEK